MMKIVKILFSIIAIVVIVVAALAWYVFSNLNGLVQELVESEGTKLLQTPVELRKVDIKLLEGSASLGQFSIANYPDFNQAEFIGFDTITVDIDPQSVNSDVIVLDEVTISGISLVAEQKGTTTNIQTLLSKLPKSESSEEAEGESSSGAEKRIAIKKLNFIGNQMSLATEDYGTHSVDLPKITRTNIGDANTGLSPEELGVEILKPLLKEAKDAVEEKVKNLAVDKLKEKYGDQLDKEKDKLKEKAKEALGDDAEEKLKSLKKLL